MDPEVVGKLGTVVTRIRGVAADLLGDAGVAATVDAPDEVAALRLSAEARRHLYLIVKESLTNVVRHAHATSVAIQFAAHERGLRCTIEDDGVGSATEKPAAETGGRGLASMRARAAAAGGTLVIGSAPGVGTRIELWLPRAALTAVR